MTSCRWLGSAPERGGGVLLADVCCVSVHLCSTCTYEQACVSVSTCVHVLLRVWCGICVHMQVHGCLREPAPVCTPALLEIGQGLHMWVCANAGRTLTHLDRVQWI